MAATDASPGEALTPDELVELWPILDAEDRVEGLRQLDREVGERFFLSRTAAEQATLILKLPEGERRSWMRLLASDDATDVVQYAAPSADEAWRLSWFEGAFRTPGSFQWACANPGPRGFGERQGSVPLKVPPDRLPRAVRIVAAAIEQSRMAGAGAFRRVRMMGVIGGG